MQRKQRTMQHRRRILVTGGFGFLGSHLIERLARNRADDIHVVDNLSTNPIPHGQILNGLGNPTNLTYDIASVSEFCRSSATVHFDEVYHLASLVGPVGILAHSGRIALSIIQDAVAIGAFSRDSGARLLFVSSSEVYGGGQSGLCSEHMPRMIAAVGSPRLEYACGKLSAETALLNMGLAINLDVRIVRPFNVSGPRQSGRGGFVLPRFVAQALSGEDLTVFGNGSQVRAFTHVEDTVSGIVAAMATDCPGEVFNLGNPANRTSILSLAKSVLHVTRSTSQISFVDPRALYGPLYAEASDKFPNASKAMERLQWRPIHGIEKTILDTCEYMRPLSLLQRADLAGISTEVVDYV
jgi:UDP-glucose 4-epimerase